MKWDAVFYGSSTGNTENVAEQIAEALGIDSMYEISNPEAMSALKEGTNLIIGASTWGIGDLQDDWEDAIEDFKDIDFANKTVAIFGLGDQEGYDDTFVDGMRPIYDAVTQSGGKIVGHTSLEGYDFSESLAVIDDRFLGLVIDEDNQDDLTEERIKTWCNELLDI